MAVKSKLVYAKATFIALHHWPEAPVDRYEYLRYPHRHEFYVKAGVFVESSNRQVEFHLLKDTLLGIFRDFCSMDLRTFSCENYAEYIGEELQGLKYNVAFIDVSEDGENGATVYF